ncbi:uncharacterized protein A1O9_04832 [Exophiala aquamarina CBS 119918]|uniref:Uncharacterized protein n=1 Tax=Exophiala aquamarina CBS 119918 TaxID=1182545 RepID=A0A072PIN6_9EURO|nr:uncharacterized protein A1O9_04832 [Exophiala aquamarina CBS 119918]KEF59984.1 hypothetical protein A1O9_04832 [Exophiala aquamarina CBS 119918]
MEELPVFRAAKRRKHVRGASQSIPDPIPSGPNTPSIDQVSDHSVALEDNGSADADVPTLIKARKQFRRPATGVHFSTSKARFGQDDSNDGALVKADQTVERPVDITQRFVGGSGQVVDVDQHMIAFIDSEMAKRRDVQSSSVGITTQTTSSSNINSPTSDGKPISLKQGTSTNPASAQQLSEVDLGSSAHEINLARTQAALERAKLGKAPLEEEEIKPVKLRKPRLGRDGKPTKPRPRKRRNSEDIARDALVEQVLHENRLDLYENGANDGRTPTAGLSESATQQDERLAEEFRQNFLDAVAQRQQRNKASSQPKVPGATTESRGPKLGGSRSARAKMAQLQQQQQGQAKK